MSPLEHQRSATGVPGLDDLLHGGFLEGDAILLAGSPGTGKTTMAMHYLDEGIKRGEPGVMISFEYLPQQIYRDCEGRGIPARQYEADGMLRIICTTPEILLADDGAGHNLLLDAVEEIGAKRLVIDSMTHFELLGKGDADLRLEIAGLMTRLRLLDVTSIVTHEIPEIIGPAVRISRYGLEFLVDGVVMLRYVELEGAFEKALSILKMRGTGHDRRFHQVLLDESGMRIGAPFAGVENISGGSARRSMKQRARELI